MLMPTHTDGFYVFAGNSIAIMATSDEATINAENWKETLLHPLATFGHYDPFFDPGGYRAVMACMLADHVEPGLSKKLLEHPGRMVVTPGSKPVPQFIFTYLSSAQKSGKPFVILPDEMALSNDEMNPIYTGKRCLIWVKARYMVLPYRWHLPFRLLPGTKNWHRNLQGNSSNLTLLQKGFP